MNKVNKVKELRAEADRLESEHAQDLENKKVEDFKEKREKYDSLIKEINRIEEPFLKKETQIRLESQEATAYLDVAVENLHKDLLETCPHLETKEKEYYNDGSYYDSSYREYTEYCEFCGSIVSTRRINGGFG